MPVIQWAKRGSSKLLDPELVSLRLVERVEMVEMVGQYRDRVTNPLSLRLCPRAR